MSDKGFCVSVTSALALVAFVFVMRFMPDIIDWTPWPACGQGTCSVQGWLGALSGWAAAIAAGITIRSLFKQADAAQKQTDFLLGDSTPTIDILPHQEEEETIVVRIVNWNRRTLLIHNVTADALDVSFNIWKIEVGGRTRTFPIAPNFEPPMVLKGWEDRQTAPKDVIIDVVAFDDNGQFINRWDRSIGVSIICSLLGEKHQAIRLTASYAPR